jgi:hypothetical protein
MTTRKDTNSRIVRQIQTTLIHYVGTDCQACGRETIVGGSPRDGRTFNLGHVVSEHNGGKFELSNLLPICRRCNKWMGERDWQGTAPMLHAPIDVPLMRDPGATETNMEAPAWAV